MKHIEKILCVGFILYFTIAAIGAVGTSPTRTGAFGWDLPWMVFGVIAIPAWLAYQAGRKDGGAS